MDHCHILFDGRSETIVPGTIELSEMVDIIGILYEMEGVGKECADERAHGIFEKLDFNGDGHLDEDEFVKGCLDDDDLVRLLNAGGIDPEDLNEEDVL